MITRRRIGVFLKVVISFALVWLLLDAVGAEGAFDRLVDVHPGWLALAMGLGLVQVCIGALRWRAVLSAMETPVALAKLFRFNFIGAFFNQTLPSSVGGDAVRGYLAYKSGLKLGVAVNGVLLDRIATVLAMVLLVAAMTPIGVSSLEGGAWFARGVWIVLALAVGGTVAIMVLDRLPKRLHRFRLVKGLSVLAVDARRALLHPLNSFWVMVLSVIGHVNLSMLVFALAMGVAVDITPVDCLLLFPPVLLIQTLPISVAGWGVREGAMVAMFAMVGVDAQSALAMSILYGVTLALTSLPGALFWMTAGVRSMEEAEIFAEQ